MHPIRALLLLCACLFVIVLIVGRGPMQELVANNKRCIVPLSPRMVGMDPYDSADFALHALQQIARGDPIGQSYVCWAVFLSSSKPSPRVPHMTRLASSMYNYLPTSALRAAVRDEVLNAFAADHGSAFTQLNPGSLVRYNEDGTEVVAFNLADGRTLNVTLMVEDGLRYVTALEFLSPDGRSAASTPEPSPVQ